MALTSALLDLFTRGQALLAGALVPVVIIAMLSLWQGRSSGCRLRWHGGNWYYLRRGGAHWQFVDVHGLILPFLVQLFISDGSRRWSCFIFHDSLDEETLKTLRRLLLLQR
ncbi:MAG: protein YgfX [Halieaceae bacterium]